MSLLETRIMLPTEHHGQTSLLLQTIVTNSCSDIVCPKTRTYSAVIKPAYCSRNVNGTKESRRKLMMTRESSCRWTRNGTSGPVSTHMAGIFLLRQGDEISVRTSAQSLLHRSSATTYMGLHMV